MFHTLFSISQGPTLMLAVSFFQYTSLIGSRILIKSCLDRAHFRPEPNGALSLQHITSTYGTQSWHTGFHFCLSKSHLFSIFSRDNLWEASVGHPVSSHFHPWPAPADPFSPLIFSELCYAVHPSHAAGEGHLTCIHCFQYLPWRSIPTVGAAVGVIFNHVHIQSMGISGS